MQNLFDSYGNSKLYKTGDLARYLPDGNIEFIGRSDNQVKIRGYRIELGEIEAVLNKHPNINNAVVIPKKTTNNDKRLVAYLEKYKNYSVSKKDLTEYLSHILPNYMVPSNFIWLKKFPLTKNGKTDIMALPDPDDSKVNKLSSFNSYNNPIEPILVSIWGDLLEINSFSTEDNFFELGGHSLLAVRLIHEIEKVTTKQISVSTLFQFPTIKQLANHLIEDAFIYPSSAVEKLHPKGNKRPIFFCYVGGSGFLLLADIIRCLGPDQPIYGLRAMFKQWNKDVKSKNQIDDIADFFTHEIQKIQPTGPYNLAGFCLGGNIVYEVACRLNNEGHKISFLSLVDTTIADSIPYRLWAIKKLSNKLLNTFIRQIKKILKSGPITWSKEIEYKLNNSYNNSQIRNDQQLPITEVLLNQFRLHGEISREIIEATLSYKPKNYKGDVLLLFGADTRITSRNDKRLKLKKYINGEVKIQQIPGGHAEIIKNPKYSSILANTIKEHLRN